MAVFRHEFNDGAPAQTWDSWEQLSDWAGKEAAAWEWLKQLPISQNDQLSSLQRRYRNLPDISRLALQIAGTKTEGESTGWRTEVQKFLSNLGPRSNSPIGQFILEAKDDPLKGPLVAAGILHAKVSPDFRIAGIVELALYDVGISPKTAKVSKRALDKLVEQYDKQFQSHIEEIKSAEQSRADAFDLEEKRRAKSADDKMSLIDQRGNAICTKLEETQKIYDEFMGLQAPVDYWSKRAEDHKGRQRKAFWATIISSVLGALVLGSIYSWIVGKLDRAEASLAIDHAILLAIGAVATTAILWLLRILVRITLSERHLKTNAEERSVMLKTYLALTKEREATKEDRHIALSSVFLPSSDGIIRDDAAPDVSLAGLLSKLLAK